MSRVLYFYSPLSVSELELLLASHQKNFDELLEDTFSDDELLQFESLVDSIAAVSAQPVMEELRVEDLEFDEIFQEEQKSLFERCHSCLCFENVPYLDSNPFQVSYFLELLSLLDEVLIDKGGLTALLFKGNYLMELNLFKGITSLFKKVPVKKFSGHTLKVPVDPIDFLIRDTYEEMDRVIQGGLLTKALEGLQQQGDNLKKIFFVMREEKLDAISLPGKVRLGPKDFDDTLEKLKFFLRKIN